MKPEVYDKTIIVWNGRPFFLQTTPLGYSGDVCQDCQLKEWCMGSGEEYRFRDLCSPDEGEAPYRFIEDWNNVDKPFIEVIESQVEYVAPPSESRLIQGEEKR
jgi:hypothetical protein